MNKYTKTYNVILDNMDLNQYRLRPISAIMYLQDAFARYCATKKMAAYDLFATNQYWVVAGFNMDFEEELPLYNFIIISLLSVLEKLSNFEFDIIGVFKFELKVQFFVLVEILPNFIFELDGV